MVPWAKQWSECLYSVNNWDLSKHFPSHFWGKYDVKITESVWRGSSKITVAVRDLGCATPFCTIRVSCFTNMNNHKNESTWFTHCLPRKNMWPHNHWHSFAIHQHLVMFLVWLYHRTNAVTIYGRLAEAGLTLCSCQVLISSPVPQVAISKTRKLHLDVEIWSKSYNYAAVCSITLQIC